MTLGIDSMTPVLFEVTRIWREIPQTYSLEIMPQQNTGAFTFYPGQFNMLYVFGSGEIPISISGNPINRNTIIHTIRSVGYTSRAMTLLRPGEQIGVRGPFGTFWPVEEAEGKDVVIAAGGIGLAPLRPLIYQMITERDRFSSVTLLIGARAPDELLYSGEFDIWRKSGLTIDVTVDKANEQWHGTVGVVTKLVGRAGFDPPNTIAYVCGPEIMIRFTAAEFMKYGVAADQIFISLERSMECGVGLCGHCQFGPYFICKDGPVFQYAQVQNLLKIREL